MIPPYFFSGSAGTFVAVVVAWARDFFLPFPPSNHLATVIHLALYPYFAPQCIQSLCFIGHFLRPTV